MLAVIEGIQLRLKRTFSAKEIESGILEDLIIESDYDVLRVVSNARSNAILSRRRSTSLSNVQ